MNRLPEWERGTPAVLCVAGPHPIPITAFLRAGDDRILLALGRRRETLRRLREDPSVALLLIGATEMLDSARWRWCAPQHGEAEDAILAELRTL